MPWLSERIGRSIVPPAFALASVASLILGLNSMRLELILPNTTLTPVTDGSETAQSQLITLPEAQKVDFSVDMIAERTLFLQRRAPWQAEPIAIETVDVPPVQVQPPSQIEPEKPQAPEVTLLGIIRGQSGTRALVITPNMTTEAWKNEGDLIEGWTIDEILGNGMSLHLEGDQFMVNINR